MNRKPTKWTPEMEGYLRKNYPWGKDVKAIAAKLGVSTSAVYCHAGVMKLVRKRFYRPMKYTQEQFDFVCKHYPNMSQKTLSVVSGVTESTIRHWRYKNGWHKSDTYLQECHDFINRDGLTPEQRYRKKHHDRVLARQRRYRQTHKEVLRERLRQWRAKQKLKRQTT